MPLFSLVSSMPPCRKEINGWPRTPWLGGYWKEPNSGKAPICKEKGCLDLEVQTYDFELLLFLIPGTGAHVHFAS